MDPKAQLLINNYVIFQQSIKKLSKFKNLC